MNLSIHFSTAVRRLALVLLLTGMAACTDPLDRQQGEPSAFEEGETQGGTEAGGGY